MPSLWFERSEEPCWVIVRAVRYPEKEAQLPENIEAIQFRCAHMGKMGYFASVAVSSSDEPFDDKGHIMPLYRGYGLYYMYVLKV